MPRKKPIKLDPNQSVYWFQLFTLLNTTNLIENSDIRRSMAVSEDVRGLKDSCISYRDDKQHDWKTNWITLPKLLGLMLQECEVGRNGTSLRDCIRGVNNACGVHKVDSKVQCNMFKSGRIVGVTISQLHHQEAKVAEEIRYDPNMIASNGGTAEVGQDQISLRWEIPMVG